MNTSTLFRQNHWFCLEETREEAIQMIYQLNDEVHGSRIKEKIKSVLSNCVNCTDIFYDIVAEITDQEVIKLVRDLELKRNLPCLRKCEPLELATCFLAMMRDPLWVNPAFIAYLKEQKALSRNVDNFPLDAKCLNGLCFLLLMPDSYCKSFAGFYIPKLNNLNADVFLSYANTYVEYIVKILDNQSAAIDGVFQMEKSEETVLSALSLILTTLSEEGLKIVMQKYKLDRILSSLPHSRAQVKVVGLLSSHNLMTLDFSSMLDSISRTSIPYDQQDSYTNDFIADLNVYSNISFQSDKVASFLNNPNIADKYKVKLRDQLYTNIINDIESDSFSKTFYSTVIFILNNNASFSNIQFSLFVKCITLIKTYINNQFTGAPTTTDILSTISDVLSAFSFSNLLKDAPIADQLSLIDELNQIFYFPTIRSHSLSNLQTACHEYLQIAISSLHPSSVQSALQSHPKSMDVLISSIFINELSPDLSRIFRYFTNQINTNEFLNLINWNATLFLDNLIVFISHIYSVINQGHYYFDVLLKCTAIFEYCPLLFIGQQYSDLLLNVQLLYLNLIVGVISIAPSYHTILVEHEFLLSEISQCSKLFQSNLIQLLQFYKNINTAGIPHNYHKYYTMLYLVESSYPVLIENPLVDEHLRIEYTALVESDPECMAFIKSCTSASIPVQLPSVTNSDRPTNAKSNIPINVRKPVDDLNSDSSSIHSIPTHLPLKREVAAVVDVEKISKKYKPDYSIPVNTPFPSFSKPITTELHVNSLLRELLSWDISNKSQFPSYKPLTNSPPFKEPVSVPNKFNNIQHYHDVYLPLLYYELYEGIMAQLDEMTDQEIEETTISTSIVQIQSVDDFSQVMCELNDKVFLENDVVVIKVANEDDDAFLGFISSASYIKGKFTIQIKAHEKLIQRRCQMGSKLHLYKIYSCTTNIREFHAFGKIGSFPLCNDILSAKIHAGHATNTSSANICAKFNLNQPQSLAVQNATSRKHGFSLIQGPPGTGKTSTILAIINTFLLHPPVRSKGNRISTPGSKYKMPTILVCAPSNAAIDEIIRRLRKDGAYDDAGTRIYPYIVRLGVENQISNDVKHVSLDNLLNAQLESKYDEGLKDPEIRTIQLKLDKLNQLPANTRTSLESNDITSLKSQLSKLKQRRYKQINNEDTRNQIRNDLLNSANIICTTLSGAGHSFLSQLKLKLVVIDEAAQSVEPSSLIPLQWGCENCVLVGDHKQLPPTVLSQIAKQYNYEQSLFDRLYNENTSTTNDATNVCSLLSIQYRMHPDISQFPSKLFYNNQVKDGVDLIKWSMPWHMDLGAFKFYDVDSTHNNVRKSLNNAKEAKAVVDIIKYISRTYSTISVLVINVV